MSDALPTIVHRGHVDPVILQAARYVQQLGWRVTSIYRPGRGNHRTGRAMDIAPMTYTAGGFGLRTAALVWGLLHRRFPDHRWLAVAELDHVHVQLYDQDCVGENKSGQTHLYQPPHV